jgi:phage terminase Nu1 subunit (DNA packaging protein)
MVEPWITRRELAVLMGVSVRTVDRLTAAGMPSVTWGSKTRRYRASQAVHWAANVYQKEHDGSIQLRRAS